MIAPEFMDTNVVVYAFDKSEPKKQRTAQALIQRALAGEIAISTQVLAEFSTVLLHKISPRYSPNALEAVLEMLSGIRLIQIDYDIISRAVAAHAIYGVRFYDGMILATAERGGCKTLWSEDFNTSQKYFGITVQNPFV